MPARIMRYGIGTFHEYETAARQMRHQPLGHEGRHQFISIMNTPTPIKTQGMGEGLRNLARLGRTHGRRRGKILCHQNSPWTNHAPSPDQGC